MAIKQWKLDKWLKRAILQKDAEDARRSLVAGANANHAIVEGEISSTPLIQAVTKHPDLVDLLLEFGANVRGIDHMRATALHFAQDHQVVAKLLAAGADPNARSTDGSNPLHACSSIETAQLLIDAGTDPMALNEMGELPWQSIARSLEGIGVSHLSHLHIVKSCHAAIETLRALAEHGSLEGATVLCR